MKSRILFVCLAAFAAPALAQKDKPVAPTPQDIVAQAPDDAWRPLDPENTLIMDLPAGAVVIEMRPDFAPQHVQRIKELARAGFYNGLTFHRVLEGFVAQGGDPKGDGTGGSDKPNLPAEFERDTKEAPNFVEIGRDRQAARVGFVDGMPVGAQPESLRSFLVERSARLWGLHCQGVMSMARATKPDSANSQFFLMLGDGRSSLDRRYTTWGWIVDGEENARRIERGDPPSRPTPIVRARVLADIPQADRPKIEVLKTDSEAFRRYIEATGRVKDGLVRDICALKAPRRMGKKIEL
jgi:peptidylprolyl isomerase